MSDDAKMWQDAHARAVAEIARLRMVCRSSEMCIMLATSGHVTAVERVKMLNCVRKVLADAGKEPSYGV